MSYSDYEEIQVTQHPEQVHCLTKAGWKLVEIVTQGELVTAHQEVANPAGNCGGCGNYHSGGNGIINGSVAITKPVYILGLSKDPVVADLRKDLDLSKGVVSHQELEIQNLRKEVKESTDAIHSGELARDELRRTIERIQKDLEGKDTAIKHARRARKLLGDKTWKEEIEKEGSDATG